ncbi:MAG: ferrous iron transporter B [Firmicutes bacterium]|nr:ferrous iron transporter B [Bacillota bacterium]
MDRKELLKNEIGSLDAPWQSGAARLEGKGMDLRERERLTQRLDYFLLHKYLGPPIMVACFALLFWGSFALGKPVSGYLGTWFEELSMWFEQSVSGYLPPVLMGLLSDGIIRGIGSALAFFPQMLLFFAFYTVITETGYASRIASLMHRPMARLKMEGKSFTPLILGYSCNVTAIISTRSIPKRIDRLIIMLISSFTPCSARLGVILYIAAAFFAPLTATLVMSGLIVLSWAVSALVSYLIKRKYIDSGDVGSPVELPPYHLPAAMTVLRATVFRTLDFLNRIKNVVIISSVLVWFLSTFPLGTTFEHSLAARIGQLLEPLGRSMGLNWQLIVALIFGFFAKETTLSTLGVLYHASQGLGNLGSIMSQSISPLAGLTFLVVYMFYTPCVATATAIYKESRSFLFSTLSIMVSLTVAFVLGILVFNLGSLFS